MTESKRFDSQPDGHDEESNISRDQRASLDLENARSMIATLEDILKNAHNTGITPKMIAALHETIPYLQYIYGDITIENLQLLLDQMRRYAEELALQIFIQHTGSVRAAEYNPYNPNKRPPDHLEKQNPYRMSPAMAEPESWPPAPAPASIDGYVDVQPLLRLLDEIDKSEKP